MSQETLYLVAAAAIFGIGVYGLLLSQHVLRKLLALNLMGSGVFLLLVALGAGEGAPDPVPQAMVITGIVVAVSATAFALSLLVRLFQETGSTSIDEFEDDGD
jgi:multicomponent Na+:H+ antiporter subunit C